ncbi:MAG: pyridoxamine 5'-phosphate oxidase family protein [Brevibacillus sp.]|nr:pyridoxamine 5'-phosphate oxidase family protein [Brevibacillus sp.]
MAETVAQSLSDELYTLLQQERFLLLGTIDHETGAPATNAISWVYAPSPERIRLAVDSRSRIVTNLRKEPRVVLTLIGAGSSYAISGTAVIAEERMEDVPLKLTKIEVSIQSVRDVMFYGSRISVEPQYEKTYDKHAAAKLDHQVMTALRG